MYHTYVIFVFAKLSLVTETWGIFDNRHLSLINIYLLLSHHQSMKARYCSALAWQQLFSNIKDLRFDTRAEVVDWYG